MAVHGKMPQCLARSCHCRHRRAAPQQFEETLDAWMAEWHTYLCLDAPALAESDPDMQSVLDAAKAQVGGCRGLPVGLSGVPAVLVRARASACPVAGCKEQPWSPLSHPSQH